MEDMILETERTILREFTLDDLDDLHEILGDKAVMEYMEPPYCKEKTLEFLKDFCIERKGAVACVHKDKNKMIGYILFNESEPEVYEMGWLFDKKYWRAGYAYEACSALVDYAFVELSAHKIFAETIDAVKSVGLMEKMGMKLEGIQREQIRDNKGNWADLYFYGVMKKDR